MTLARHLRPARRSRRAGNTTAGLAIFLLGFSLLLLGMLHFFFIPALRHSHSPDPRARHWLGAVSFLMLAVLLAYLIAGLILTFRVGRFFFPPPAAPRKPSRTQYSDAWSEAGKRLNTPDTDDHAA